MCLWTLLCTYDEDLLLPKTKKKIVLKLFVKHVLSIKWSSLLRNIAFPRESLSIKWEELRVKVNKWVNMNPWRGSFRSPRSRLNWYLQVLFLWAFLKNREPGEKPGKRVPRTTSIHLWRRVQDSGHITWCEASAAAIAPCVLSFSLPLSLQGVITSGNFTMWYERMLGARHEQICFLKCLPFYFLPFPCAILHWK